MKSRFQNIDKRLFTILMIVFVHMLVASMVIPILPLYASRDFGLSSQAIALLVSSFFMAQFVAGPWIGRLSDKYGRLPVLIISQLGTALSFIMLAFASSAWVLYASRILDGITGGNIIVAQAYVTDITPREKRTVSLGYIFAAFGLGFIFGPAVGGVLSAAYGESIPFLIASVAAFLPALLTWRTLDETLSPEQREANRRVKATSISPLQVARNTPLVLVLLIAFIGQFALGLIQATFALFGEAVLFAGYSEEATSLGIGLLFSVVGLTQFSTQTFLLRRLVARYGDVPLVLIGTVSRTLGLLIFAMVVSPWLAGFGSLFFALGMGLAMPPLQSLATKTIPDELRGGVLGVYQSSISLSTIVSTAIGGALFAISPTTPNWLGAGLSLLVLLPAFFLLRVFRSADVQGEAIPAGD